MARQPSIKHTMKDKDLLRLLADRAGIDRAGNAGVIVSLALTHDEWDALAAHVSNPQSAASTAT